MEASAQGIHDQMNVILDDQTHYRLREAGGRKHAEAIHDRVQVWSILQLVVILFVGIMQVTIIRSFFSNRR
jgi:hypothetical protein